MTREQVDEWVAVQLARCPGRLSPERSRLVLETLARVVAEDDDREVAA